MMLRPSVLSPCVRRNLIGIALAMVAGFPLSAAGPRFFSDDPIAREPDPADASKVQSFSIHLSWDLISSLFIKEGDRAQVPSVNVNTLGEVPDSSWFTNRAGSRRLTDDEVARGPDTTPGPAGDWTVVSGKSEGVRPGFTIRDTAGVRWFIKFDAPGYPEQATSAEVVSTKLFWALGYNVAETHVATIRRQALHIAPDATITVRGKRRRLTDDDVNRILALVDEGPDHTYRAIASKAVEGKPVGEFLYYGTRADDPNDIYPHEDRRELRGMGAFAAWIDRVDAKAGNTIDTLVTEDGRTAVRHYVLDFGSTLGSAGIGPNEPWEGYEYLYAGKPLLRKLLGFGFPVEYWRTIHYPSIRGVARLEADHFDPTRWKSRVPNAAYIRAQPDDTFWAARKVTAITDSQIAAAVKSGQYTDPEAVAYLTRTLIGRRDAIGRAFLQQVNPIVAPALDEAGQLTFHNAAVEADVARAPTSYRVAWYRFDNATSESTALGSAVEVPSTSAGAPPELPSDTGTYVRVDIAAADPARPAWAAPVSTYFRRDTGRWVLVGLEHRSGVGSTSGTN
ncbi:MAG TPA: helix-turn-helix domain-containing protein [Vicinamibacterales bacterium]|nr:helix-turn-helix domain-containing protein [Vicinamibacterales bacterium]